MAGGLLRPDSGWLRKYERERLGALEASTAQRLEVVTAGTSKEYAPSA